MATFYLHVGDTLAPFHATLLGPKLVPISTDGFPLSAVATLRLRPWVIPGATETSMALTISVSGGTVDVDGVWDPSALPAAGRYAIRVHLVYPNGDIQSFPNGQPDELIVTE